MVLGLADGGIEYGPVKLADMGAIFRMGLYGMDQLLLAKPDFVVERDSGTFSEVEGEFEDDGRVGPEIALKGTVACKLRRVVDAQVDCAVDFFNLQR